MGSGGVPGMPEMPKMEMPKMGSGGIPGMPEMPKMELPKMGSGGMPGMPEMPKMELPKMGSGGIPGMPGMPKMELPKMGSGGIPGMPEMPKMELPKMGTNVFSFVEKSIPTNVSDKIKDAKKRAALGAESLTGIDFDGDGQVGAPTMLKAENYLPGDLGSRGALGAGALLGGALGAGALQAVPSAPASAGSALRAGVMRERLQAPVQLTMALDIPFHETGEEGSSKREAFKRDLEKDLANASGLPAENFKITKLSAGSVIVDMTILPDPLGAIAPSAVARNLEQQAADPNSPLRSGKLTSKTQGIQVLSPQPPPLTPAEAKKQAKVQTLKSTL